MCETVDRLRSPLVPRTRLATLPTPLERGPRLPGTPIDDGTPHHGPTLWMKRDDLTGLGGGGNKARKLEFLCGAAMADGADTLVTIGAAQSNHCRMTAAAGARLGLNVHLILSGPRPAAATGNQILSQLFGARLHHTGLDDSRWDELKVVMDALVADLTTTGHRLHSIPIGGSTPAGAVGYAVAFAELVDQCTAEGFVPSAIVVTTSSGGTHAGLLAGRAAMMAAGELSADDAPEVIAIGVAKSFALARPEVAALANETLRLLNLGGGDDDAARVTIEDVQVDARWLGEGYATPSAGGDAAIRWAAEQGGWLLDRTYSGKGCSGLLGLAAEGRWSADQHVIFVHTGGWPALFALDGVPAG